MFISICRIIFVLVVSWTEALVSVPFHDGAVRQDEDSDIPDIPQVSFSETPQVPEPGTEAAGGTTDGAAEASCCFEPVLKPEDLQSAVTSVIEQVNHGGVLVNNTLLDSTDTVLSGVRHLAKELEPMKSLPFVGGFVGNLMVALDGSTSSLEQLLVKTQRNLTEISTHFNGVGGKCGKSMSTAGTTVQSLISEARAFKPNADVMQAHGSDVVKDPGVESSAFASARAHIARQQLRDRGLNLNATHDIEEVLAWMKAMVSSVKHVFRPHKDTCSGANRSVHIATYDQVIFQKQMRAVNANMLSILHDWPRDAQVIFDELITSMSNLMKPTYFPDRLRILVTESIVQMRKAMGTTVKHTAAAHAQISDSLAATETSGLGEINDQLVLLHQQVDSGCNILASVTYCVDRQC